MITFHAWQQLHHINSQLALLEILEPLLGQLELKLLHCIIYAPVPSQDTVIQWLLFVAVYHFFLSYIVSYIGCWFSYLNCYTFVFLILEGHMVTYRCYFMSISVMEIISLEIILHLFSLPSYLHVWHDGSLNVNYHYSFVHARSYKKWVNFPTMAMSFSQCDCIKIKYYIFNRPS